MIKKLKAYLSWEKESLHLAQETLRQRNRRLLIVLQSAMIVAYLGLLAFGLIQNGYSSFQTLFVFMLIYMALCLGLIIKTPTIPVDLVTYAVYIVTILLCMYAACFVDPDYINSEAYIFFLLFPIVYVDFSVRVDAVNLALAAAYLYNVLSYKNGKAMILDAINVVTFSLLGVVVGHFVRWQTLTSLIKVHHCQQEQLKSSLIGLPNHKCLRRDLAELSVMPQAVLFIKINEFDSPILSFGPDYEQVRLLQLGDELAAVAREQGLELYACGSAIIGLAQPRILEGVFQRLEPLYHVLNQFEYVKSKAKTVKLHFGIGASMCGDDIEAAMERAAASCRLAQKDGVNRIMLS